MLLLIEFIMYQSFRDDIFQVWFSFIKVFFDWEGFIFITITFIFNIFVAIKITYSYWFISILFLLLTIYLTILSTLALIIIFLSLRFYFLFSRFLSTFMHVVNKCWFTAWVCFKKTNSFVFNNTHRFLWAQEYS